MIDVRGFHPNNWENNPNIWKEKRPHRLEYQDHFTYTYCLYMHPDQSTMIMSDDTTIITFLFTKKILMC